MEKKACPVKSAEYRTAQPQLNGVKKMLKTVKSVLFADPNLLYKEEIELTNQPFYFPGINKKAVLLIHGWTSTSYELRRLGRYLNENGYSVSCPMLRGHGTVPKDLENVKWSDWITDIKKSYAELKATHEKVYVAGTSIGSCLAVILAKEKEDISGLVLMAMPYKIKFERIVNFLAKANLLFRKYNKKYYPPTFGVSTTITRLIAYQTYPIKSTLEVFELVKIARKNLRFVKQPCFIIQSGSDHVASRGSIKNIYSGISSKVKKKKLIKRAYHTFISDIKNESVFEEINKFLNEN
jgi:carboxylesterase